MDKIETVCSKSTTENGNIFLAHGAKTKTVKEVRNLYKKIASDPEYANAPHRILVFRFKDSSGKIHD
ncbi:hypothetical protein KUTeg_016071 [Tegillarca granosa]|uniref:Uncharacterized protein n=1 Tax=Tegillarca granosa TaxID=220873 RepID=A0ABQ9EJT7_TEGGR|nr:hypothetical protein KUTeg_016071 [Tegillarca granosa]